MNRLGMRALWCTMVVGPGAMLATAAFGQFAGGYKYPTGPDIYSHVCQGCHMPDGRGAVGAGTYPALANNPKLQASLYPVLVMLKGQKAMPAFSDLTDAQIVEVTNYIRTNFGNNFSGPVTIEQVKALRSQAIKLGTQRAG